MNPEIQLVILETQRLLLRQVTPGDKNEIFAYRSDKIANRYQGWIPETPEDVEAFIHNIATQINIQGTWFQFVIIEKNSLAIIGDLGIHFFDHENLQAELGCTLRKEAQHLGYAVESIAKVIDYLFIVLAKHRIVASVDPGNKPAIRSLENIGFRKEAHCISSLRIRGEWVDELLFALLDTEWATHRQNQSG